MPLRDSIIPFLEKKKRLTSTDVARHFHVTRQHASHVLGILVDSGTVSKFGSTRSAFYTLPQHIDRIGPAASRRRFKNTNIEEHEIMSAFIEPFPAFRTAPENVRSIIYYAFSEMLNNAIEHSASEYIEVAVESEGGIFRFIVSDFGIGVFRNVMRKRKLKSELEAMQDLLKGKTTTSPKAHSGEGIFFTSKAADKFVLESFGHRMIVDNSIPDVFFEEEKDINRGTRVIFSISRKSDRHLKKIFDHFQSRPGSYAFDKTEIRVRLYTIGTVYVSRSQARRILVGFEKFKKVILDFDRVSNVGQAFADEIFRVFKERHPKIDIRATNMKNSIRFMVERAQRTIR